MRAAGRFRLMEKQVRLARLLAGPDADEARLLRARAALGAIRASMEATGGLCLEVGDPYGAQQSVQLHIETIVASALGALEGCCMHSGPATKAPDQPAGQRCGPPTGPGALVEQPRPVTSVKLSAQS